MTGEENSIKSLCAKSGLNEKEELQKYQQLREKGMAENVAFSIWYQDNKKVLSQVTGDFEGIILEFHRGGKRKWPKGYSPSQEERKQSKVEARAEDPQVVWIHDCLLAVFNEGKVVVVDAAVWDDPSKDEEHPLLAQKNEPLPGMEVSLPGWALSQKGAVPRLSPRKGAKAKVSAPGKVAEKVWAQVKGVDIAVAQESQKLGTNVYEAMVGEVVVNKNKETGQVTCFFKLATTRSVPASMPVDKLDGYMGAIELPYWPDAADGELNEDDLNKAYQGKNIKLCATLWPKRDGEGNPTGEIGGRINTMQ